MANNHNDHHSHDSQHGGGHHIVPLSVYYRTLGALLVLTIVTVGASYLNFGSTMNVVVSLAIASTKAALVLMFFMGLKYDTVLNRVYILSSFVALILLLAVTGTDLWSRPKPTPAPVKNAAGPLSQQEFDELMAGGPALVAKGKALFDVNCATCHGPQGHGDGAGGASLNPKPRNFQAPASEWKNGTSSKAMYVTLAYGIPGSGMASYKALPPADRVALIHYVHTLTATVENQSKADDKYAQALKEDEVGGSSGPKKVALPIDFAMDRLLKN